MSYPESVSQLLQVCARKTEDFVRLLDSKHMVWLLEIEEAARKMFSSDFSAEPELMPKTPSQKRRRKKRTSIVSDENRDPSGRRLSRRSSASWSTSVRRLSTRQMNKALETSIPEETVQPKRVTRARVQASIVCMPAAERPLQELTSSSANDRILQVKISAEDRHSAELQITELVALGSSAPPVPVAPAVVAATEHPAPVTPPKNDRTAAKLKIADSSTPRMAAVDKESVDLTLESPQPVAEAAKALALELSNHSMTPTGSRSDRRSVRRSIVAKKSISSRSSLANKYSLASKRESMTKEAVRKSIRRSVSKKKATETSSSSSYKSYQSSVEVVDDEVIVRTEDAELAETALTSGSHSLRTRGFKKIAISNLPDSDQPQRMATRQSLTLNTEPGPDTYDDQTIRRKSYKRAVDELSDEHLSDDEINSPPRKKTPSPPCPPSKVVKPPPHMKSFLHTVQKNQFLMMTPGSIGKSLMVKSFIKRNTPLKTDPKEKERQRLEVLRKKEEAELQRKQKIEEGKKRKQEELKLRREERLRKVLQARERVEQMEEEKKKKMEQKYAQIDEKSEKVREDRMAEEKSKKKITAKKQEEIESRRRQEEEARKLKAKQEEEDRRQQELLIQKKREEEEQERQRKLAEAKKLAEMRQAEQERERQRELQLAAEKEQERFILQRERERVEKEKALLLQRDLERVAQEKEQQRREAEERKKRERLEQERQERLHREMEAKKLKEQAQRLREEQERLAAVANAPVLNVTVDIQKSPACESYDMTPKSCKPYSSKANSEDYGMDLNSDDSTDDEGKPRKPIPAWASGNQLDQSVRQQYYHPIDLDRLFGTIDSPKLENMFNKSKPRFYKRTSSAVWHSPPLNSNRQHLTVGYGLKKF
ncbi:inner centromere protein [Pseudophryne corroboree]|uniref:inner centromere protein n=1 Tax=Pseudophryne corroboree TaxID=495146 RepID=UPI0030818C6C